jgi:hypothetical protein
MKSQHNLSLVRMLKTHRTVQSLNIMRTFNFILVLFVSGLLAFADEPTDKPVLSFSLTATNQSFSHQLTSGLMLRVEHDALGWEVGVFQGDSEDSLLYPQRNWHGAYPCQISAWSYCTQAFPDERIIPIRGYKSTVRILLIDAVVSGEPGKEQFTSGRVEIYWKKNV